VDPLDVVVKCGRWQTTVVSGGGQSVRGCLGDMARGRHREWWWMAYTTLFATM